ncbi:MAG: RNA 2',3'-cyclic phosphodiesterase [Ignavibacteriales bacterium]|nr:RNA 2',3'-cyclic phosphodiesterase [Ignavibacteriales bacterium]
MAEVLHRSFIGIFPPKEIHERLIFIQSKMKPFAPHAKWESEDKFHITMEFLGNKTEEWLDRLHDDMQSQISASKFTVILTRCGSFPTKHSPKVFWIGSEPAENPQLIEVLETIRKSANALVHSPDTKPFHPHITVGRAKGKISSALIQNLETVTFHPIEFMCSEIRIIMSRLASTGSTYTTLFTIPLK